MGLLNLWVTPESRSPGTQQKGTGANSQTVFMVTVVHGRRMLIEDMLEG
jgi:hypothetical protein